MIDGPVVEQGMWRIRTNQELGGDFKSRKLMEWRRWALWHFHSFQPNKKKKHVLGLTIFAAWCQLTQIHSMNVLAPGSIFTAHK